jgi:hypothetical protein
MLVRQERGTRARRRQLVLQAVLLRTQRDRRHLGAVGEVGHGDRPGAAGARAVLLDWLAGTAGGADRGG